MSSNHVFLPNFLEIRKQTLLSVRQRPAASGHQLRVLSEDAVSPVFAGGTMPMSGLLPPAAQARNVQEEVTREHGQLSRLFRPESILQSPGGPAC